MRFARRNPTFDYLAILVQNLELGTGQFFSSSDVLLGDQDFGVLIDNGREHDLNAVLSDFYRNGVLEQDVTR